jgi:lysophospholipase L1-like esterase
MKRVFIYGDSNVWGENFAGPRIPYHLRWANRLKRSLRDIYKITTDGVSGRVAGNYRSDKPELNGQSTFRESYEKAEHVDIVVIALGTNDLQERFNRSADNIIDDLSWYSNATDGGKVIYLLPPNFNDTEESGPEFTSKSQKLRHQIIKKRGELIDYIAVDNIELSDGVHFSKQGHKLIANTVGERLRATI